MTRDIFNWSTCKSRDARAASSQSVTHLFEAEGHREDTDPNDAVHHVHDETPVGRRHF